MINGIISLCVLTQWIERNNFDKKKNYQVENSDGKDDYRKYKCLLTKRAIWTILIHVGEEYTHGIFRIINFVISVLIVSLWTEAFYYFWMKV